MDDFVHHRPPSHPPKRKQGHDDDQALPPPSPESITAAEAAQQSPPRRAHTRPTDFHHDHNVAKRPRIDTELPVVQTPRMDVTPTTATTAVSTPSTSTASTPPSPSSMPPSRQYHSPSRSSRQSPKRRNPRPVITAAPNSSAYIQAHVATVPLDFKNLHCIPPSKPLINRSTLKELELDVILRNPVIRHDLLFDPGLQFRPRRKVETFERYWNAVWEEVQTGCTCVSFDAYGQPHTSKICVCELDPIPLHAPIVRQVFPSSSKLPLYTLRAPSRILPLLTEFLEVLLLVIQPLSNTAIYTDPLAIHEQAAEHSLHAAHLRSIFDPELIAQEVKRKVWDPSGVFREIGETLKCHCAPMRDGEVEALVKSAAVKGEGMKAVKTCLELLELMKLDIANHQLSQLRPWLLRNTGAFEVKAFKLRFGGSQDSNVDQPALSSLSLHNTREWLHKTHETLVKRKTPIPRYGGQDRSECEETKASASFRYSEDLTRNQKIYVAALKGIVDLVFDTLMPFVPIFPRSTPVSAITVSSSGSAYAPPSVTRQIPMPETMYLDKARLANLGADAAELTGLYMTILLFRQLVFSSPIPGKQLQIRKEDTVRVKREIKDIAPIGFGNLLLSSSPVEDDVVVASSTNEERKRVRNDLILQISRRAGDIRERGNRKGSVEDTSSSLSSPAPDSSMTSIAQNWADTNLVPGSTLSQFLHCRVKDAVFEVVLGLAWGGPGSTNVSSASLGLLEKGDASFQPIRQYRREYGMGLGAGMEPLQEDISRLAEKIARLALVHLNTHLPMYEQEGFFSDRLI